MDFKFTPSNRSDMWILADEIQQNEKTPVLGERMRGFVLRMLFGAVGVLFLNNIHRSSFDFQVGLGQVLAQDPHT